MRVGMERTSPIGARAELKFRGYLIWPRHFLSMAASDFIRDFFDVRMEPERPLEVFGTSRFCVLTELREVAIEHRDEVGALFVCAVGLDDIDAGAEVG